MTVTDIVGSYYYYYFVFVVNCCYKISECFSKYFYLSTVPVVNDFQCIFSFPD